jgi:putative ABC transport system substrate-binding protein
MFDIRRRVFITLLGGAATLSPRWQLAAHAQQTERLRRVGLVMGYIVSDPEGQAQVAAFRQELQSLGWTEGRNIQIDIRYATDVPSQIRALADELMDLKPDLMVSNTNLVTAVLQAKVRTVPLLFIGVSDPIGSGFVTDLARPAGNVTGFAYFEHSMGSKWLETLSEIAPRVEHVGFILHPETAPNLGFLKAAETAAPSLKVKLTPLGVHSAEQIVRSVTAFAGEANRGLIIAPHAVTFVNRDLIVDLSARYLLPTIYPLAFYARAGGLLSYGVNPIVGFRAGAAYVDRILKGAKPADLPVQHPTRFELVINLKTAKALGLEVPLHLQQLADEVIE